MDRIGSDQMSGHQLSVSTFFNFERFLRRNFDSNNFWCFLERQNELSAKMKSYEDSLSSQQDNFDQLKSKHQNGQSELGEIRLKIQELRKYDEILQSDIESLRVYENKMESSFESHEIRLNEHQQTLEAINTAKKSAAERAGKIQSEIETIRTRMEELEKVSSQGVDVLKLWFRKSSSTLWGELAIFRQINSKPIG